jgi:hypothetical protein
LKRKTPTGSRSARVRLRSLPFPGLEFHQKKNDNNNNRGLSSPRIIVAEEFDEFADGVVEKNRSKKVFFWTQKNWIQSTDGGTTFSRMADTKKYLSFGGKTLSTP